MLPPGKILNPRHLLKIASDKHPGVTSNDLSEVVVSRLAFAFGLCNQPIGLHGLSQGIGLLLPLGALFLLRGPTTLFLLSQFLRNLLLCLNDLHLLVPIEVVIVGNAGLKVSNQSIK